MQCPDGEEIQHCYTDFTCHPVQDTTAIIEDIFAQTQTCMMDEQLKKHNVKSLYISSSDSLRNRRIIQTIPQGWNDRPPLFNGKDQDSLLNTVSNLKNNHGVVSLMGAPSLKTLHLNRNR
jgi:hypothetical protein